METEVYDDNLDVIIRYYGTPWQDEADFPMNFQFIDLGNDSASWTGTKLEATVLNWMRKMPSNKWPNWVVRKILNSWINFRSYYPNALRPRKVYTKNVGLIKQANRTEVCMCFPFKWRFFACVLWEKIIKQNLSCLFV